MSHPDEPGPSAAASPSVVPSTEAPQRTAGVLGLGLIGGSVALGLSEQGWRVVGDDHDPSVVESALANNVISESGLAGADIVFVAVPAASVTGAVQRALSDTNGFVTDVASVKTAIAGNIDDPRFMAGHPMAGSEQSGLDGARPDLFDGAVWVLCPSASTDDTTLVEIRSVVSTLGADVVVIDPERHDELVAMISHVPHLTAATLMRLASDRSLEHRALLRLAAGGFRDMTRIASGDPGMWIDICAANKLAIASVLDDLVSSLGELKEIIVSDDSERLLELLTDARAARTNLPSSALHPSQLSEIRVPVTDQPGELQQVLSLAGELNINVYDIEISHSAERDGGLLIVVVSTESAPMLDAGLVARGYRPRIKALQ